MIRDQLAAALRAALSTLEVTPLPETINLERPARREHGDWSSNVALAAAKKAGWNPRELAGTARRDPERRPARPRHLGRGRRPGVRELPAGRLVAPRRAGRGGRGRAPTATPAADVGDGRQGHGRVRQRQPHRAAARRPRPGRRLRRLARPGARAGRARRSPGRTTSTTAARRCSCSWRRWPPASAASALPEGGYQGQYIVDWAAEMPEGADLLEWGEARAVADHRETLGPHERRTSTPGSASGRWSTPAPSTATLADLRERGRGLRPRRRGVAAVHRLRRRQGPRARQERRRVHLPAARHRLPPRQVRPGLRPAHRRLGGRPPRLRAAHEGRHAGARPRSRRARVRHHPAGQPAQGRRAGAVLQAGRRHRRAGRGPRRGRCRLGPAHLPAAVDRLHPDLRLRRGEEPGQWTTRSSTSRWPTPASGRSSGWPPSGRGRPGAARRGRPARCWSTSASSRCCGRCPSCPTPSSLRPTTGRRTGSPPGCASSPAPCTASTTTATSWARASAPSSPRPAWRSSRPPASASPSASTCSGVSAPEQM